MFFKYYKYITFIVPRLYPPARHKHVLFYISVSFLLLLIFSSYLCGNIYNITCQHLIYNNKKPDSIPIEPCKKIFPSQLSLRGEYFLSFNLTTVSSYKALLKIYFFSQHLQYLIQQVNAAVTFLPFDTAVIIDRHITAFGHFVLGQPQFQPQLV